MKLSPTQKKWVLFGIIMTANALMVSNWLDARSNNTRLDRLIAVETSRPSQATPDATKTAEPDALGAESQVAATPAAKPTTHGGVPQAQPSVRQPARTASVIAAPDRPVYIGHTDQVALQPRMVQALRQLIDTSHDGLTIKTLASGAQVVNTSTKFLHVAVAATAPDGNTLQQDFSTRP